MAEELPKFITPSESEKRFNLNEKELDSYLRSVSKNEEYISSAKARVIEAVNEANRKIKDNPRMFQILLWPDGVIQNIEDAIIKAKKELKDKSEVTTWIIIKEAKNEGEVKSVTNQSFKKPSTTVPGIINDIEERKRLLASL